MTTATASGCPATTTLVSLYFAIIHLTILEMYDFVGAFFDDQTRTEPVVMARW